MKEFKDIYQEVLRYGFADGPQVNETRIKEWINEGQQIIADQVETPEFQAQETKTTVSGTFKYTLPSDFGLMMSIYYPEMEYKLKPVDLQTFDLNGNVQGPPTQYTLYKSEMWVYPTPNAAEKLELRYIKSPVRMTNPTDIPTLGEAYLHLLVHYAAIRAFEAEDDPEMAKVQEARYEKDLAKYIIANTDRVDDRPYQLDGTWGSGLW